MEEAAPLKSVRRSSAEKTTRRYPVFGFFYRKYRRASEQGDGTRAARCNPDGVKRLHLSAEKETAQAGFLYYAAKGQFQQKVGHSAVFAHSVRATLAGRNWRRVRRKYSVGENSPRQKLARQKSPIPVELFVGEKFQTGHAAPRVFPKSGTIGVSFVRS